LEDLKAILSGEVEIGQNDFEEALLDLLNSLVASADLSYMVALLAEAIGDVCA
jgi:hypothetical protein